MRERHRSRNPFRGEHTWNINLEKPTNAKKIMNRIKFSSTYLARLTISFRFSFVVSTTSVCVNLFSLHTPCHYISVDAVVAVFFLVLNCYAHYFLFFFSFFTQVLFISFEEKTRVRENKRTYENMHVWMCDVCACVFRVKSPKTNTYTA